MVSLPHRALRPPTGRHGLPADIVTAHQRERLTTATIEVVAKRGYRGTTIDHILKTAKVGYVAFYELFEGKEDCFLAAFDRIAAETREELADAVAAETEWAAQICAALRALLELISTDPARARVGLVEVQTAGRKAYARYEATLDGAAAKLCEGRALSAEAAELSDTLEEAILGGIAWILQQRLVKGEGAETGGLLGEAIQIALSPYLGEPEAQRLAAATVAGRPTRA